MGVTAWDTYRRRIWQDVQEELQQETCNTSAGFAEAVVRNFIQRNPRGLRTSRESEAMGYTIETVNSCGSKHKPQ